MYKILPKTLFLGKSFKYLPSCHSTNDICYNLITENPQVMEGTLVWTSEQTAGKGQRGNKWEAQAGMNLTFSLILSPSFLKIQEQFNLNIAVCLAIHDLLKPLLGEGLKIKWPNDIYYFKNKICGILIQNLIKKENIERSIIGIGLNVNQEIFETPKATSLKNITGKDYSLIDILETLLEKTEARYLSLRNIDFEILRKEYFQTLYQNGEIRQYKGATNFEGKIVGVDPSGRLMVDKGEQIELFNYKEIEFLE